MEIIRSINEKICGLVWGAPMIVLLMGAGVFLSYRIGFIQFTRLGYILKNTFGKIFAGQKAGKGEVTPFQALSTALAGTLGTGNVAGITFAITLGGPGAMFWLWLTALIGMATKYAEVTLAVKYRERNKDGDWVGGAMYYIKNGLGKNWRWLAPVFCVLCALAAFGMGNAVQIGNIAISLNTALQTFWPRLSVISGEINVVIGVFAALLTGAVLFGGLKRIGKVTETLVPFMSIIYIAACLAVIIVNAEKIGGAFAMIFEGAFNPRAVVGGAAGIGIKSCAGWGIRRGVFTHEAGLGSAPMAHAGTSETNPVKQGFFGVFEVFADTIVICTLTGITLLVSGIDLRYGSQGTTQLNSLALGTVFGGGAGSVIIACCMTLFALSTVLTWGLYGARCAEFIIGEKFSKAYKFIFAAVCFAGATMKLDLAWEIGDTLNGLMAIPNMIAVLLLSGVVKKLTKFYFADRKTSQKTTQKTKNLY